MAFKAWRIILWVTVLSGCEDYKTLNPIGPPAGLSNQCQLYYEAYELTRLRDNRRVPQIVTGCPGEHEAKTIPERLQREYQLVAAGAEFPDQVQRQGAVAKEVFRRLLLRGVSVEIAVELVSSESFRLSVEELER